MKHNVGQRHIIDEIGRIVTFAYFFLSSALQAQIKLWLCHNGIEDFLENVVESYFHSSWKEEVTLVAMTFQILNKEET